MIDSRAKVEKLLNLFTKSCQNFIFLRLRFIQNNFTSKWNVSKIFEFLHCAHLPYFCTKSGQTTERISIQHNVEKNSLTWNSWFHEIFVKNCESKIPYIISTLTQFFSSSSWSSVAFFHKRYKIPFDNCTNSTFFLHFFW